MTSVPGLGLGWGKGEGEQSPNMMDGTGEGGVPGETGQHCGYDLLPFLGHACVYVLFNCVGAKLIPPSEVREGMDRCGVALLDILDALAG